MRRLSVIMGAVASLAANGMADAALLEPVRGGVRVNHGDGYLAVHGVTDVNPGDQVMVDPKGQARLVYPDGCKVNVKAGSVAVVGAKSPCTKHAAAVEPALVVAGALAAAGAGIGVGVAAASGGQAQEQFVPLPAVPASP
jgi:hypothetical protein